MSPHGRHEPPHNDKIAQEHQRGDTVGVLAGPKQKSLRVLFVGESEEGPEIVARELDRGEYDAEIVRVTDVAGIEERVTPPAARWDVVLAEETARVGAYKAHAIVRDKSSDTPFVIVRKEPHEDTFVESISASSRLVDAIEQAVRESLLRAEIHELREHLVVAERLASVGFLVAGVVHEINNPLSATIANQAFVHGELIRFAQAGHDAAEALSALHDASEAAGVIRQVVRDLRTFARNEMNDMRTLVDPRRILESAIRMTWHEVRGRARLTRDFQETPFVDANEARLSQVFLNLLINAAHAIEPGNVAKNEIRVVARTDEKGNFVAEVRDTGSGIAAEHLPRIFDAYFTTKAAEQGTGLGLAVSRRIVQMMGGEISAESVEGAGTCFSVVLPAAGERSESAPPTT